MALNTIIPVMTTSRRKTARKGLIEEILVRDYSGGPVLLEELRWRVLMQQYGPGFIEMTDSKMKSFARTIREHAPELEIARISIDGETPVGLVARAAVYRLRQLDQLRWFLHADDPHILCRYQTKMEVDEPRYWSSNRYVTPYYHVAAFRFFATRPTEQGETGADGRRENV